MKQYHSLQKEGQFHCSCSVTAWMKAGSIEVFMASVCCSTLVPGWLFISRLQYDSLLKAVLSHNTRKKKKKKQDRLHWSPCSFPPLSNLPSICRALLCCRLWLGQWADGLARFWCALYVCVFVCMWVHLKDFSICPLSMEVFGLWDLSPGEDSQLSLKRAVVSA